MTECYPIEYETKVSICYDEISGPYPVKAYIKFLFYDPTKYQNQTITYNLVCGTSYDQALSNAKTVYPYMKEIPCGIKTWNLYYPVTIFKNVTIFKDGYWDQKEIMIGSAVSIIVLIIMFGIAYLLAYRRGYATF